MPTNAVKRHRLDTGGPWGTGLLLLAVAAIAQGSGYATTSKPDLPHAIASIPAPMWLLGSLWVAAGSYAAVKALTPPQRHVDVWSIVAITLLWSLAYALNWLIDAIEGHFTRDWSSAVGWASLALLIICWGRCVNPPTREPRR